MLTFRVYFLIALVSVAGAQFYAPGERLGSFALTARGEISKPQCTINKGGKFCANDCKTMMTCIGDVEPIHTETCFDIQPSKPYCVDSQCTATSPGTDNCKALAISSFKCTSEGYFPDPTNCTFYYYCSALSASPEKFVCPPKYVYNAAGAGDNCKRLINNNDCVIVKCADNQIDKFILYHTNYRSFYALCLKNKDPMMFRCADNENYEYNLATRDCQFVCKREGKFVHPKCKQYYECYRTGVGLNLAYIENSCPTDQYFDKVLLRCIKGTCPLPPPAPAPPSP